MRTPGDVRSEPCFPSCSRGWSVGCPPPPLRFTLHPHRGEVSEEAQSGCQDPPRPPSLPSWDLALVLRALQTAPFEPLQSVELKFLSTPDCIGLDQEGGGPAGIFGRRIVP